MKNLFRIAALVFCGFIGTLFADDFKSETISPGGCTATCPIRVPNDRFMVIRNFTQENGTSTTRGIVQISKDGGMTWVTVLSAAFVDMSVTTPDVINNIVIAGPTDVMVKCGTGAGSCFISYKKADN